MRPIFLPVLLALGLVVPGAQAALTPSFEQVIAAPAGALIPGLKAAMVPQDDEGALLQLLTDNDPNVRAAAARALKKFAATDGRAEQALLGVMEDSWQPESVRREAIKSLPWAAAEDSRTRDQIAALTMDDSQTPTLRGIACKALWNSAGHDETTAQALRSLLEDPSQPEAVRAGAAWALFADNGNRLTQEALTERVIDNTLSTPASVRYEAVRSLYLAMGENPVAEAVRQVAEDGFAPLDLRQAAVLANHHINQENVAHQWLLQLSADDSQPQLRTVAVEAMRVGPDMDITRFFHLAWFGRMALDPLENE